MRALGHSSRMDHATTTAYTPQGCHMNTKRGSSAHSKVTKVLLVNNAPLLVKVHTNSTKGPAVEEKRNHTISTTSIALHSTSGISQLRSSAHSSSQNLSVKAKAKAINCAYRLVNSHTCYSCVCGANKFTVPCHVASKNRYSILKQRRLLSCTRHCKAVSSEWISCA